VYRGFLNHPSLRCQDKKVLAELQQSLDGLFTSTLAVSTTWPDIKAFGKSTESLDVQTMSAIPLAVRCGNIQSQLRATFFPDACDREIPRSIQAFAAGRTSASCITRQHFLAVPDSLVFILQRKHVRDGSVVRDETQFEFGLDLDVSEFVAPDIKDAGSYKFSLSSVVVHSGSAKGGHYRVFQRVQDDGRDIW
jgi:hypothetical protein